MGTPKPQAAFNCSNPVISLSVMPTNLKISMGDRKRAASKVSLGMLKGKPMSTSVPTFRFHAGEEEIEQIYPEIEEEIAEKDYSSSNDTLSVSPPVAPPRSPRHGRTLHKPHSGISSSGNVSPVHASPSVGNLSKRSSSMDMVDTPGHNSGWGLFTDIKGKFVRTVEERKSDRQKSEAPKLNASLKDNASFSDSEEASSSESNQIPSYYLSTSDSVSQLSGTSGMSSLSTTPTTPSNVPLNQRSSQSSGKWHCRFLGDRHSEEEKNKTSRPTTPVKNLEDKGSLKSSRAGSVPLVHEEAPIGPQKRSTSLRSRFRPKESEPRNNRKRVNVDSRSNSSLSGALYSPDGDETDDDEVESGVEALEVPWESANSAPSNPLGAVVNNFHHGETLRQEGSLKSLLLSHNPHFPRRKNLLLQPSPGVASMLMGSKPFEIPDYSSLPVLQAPTVKEILPTDSFQGWMNELNGTYDTKSYHISMTESVFVKLEGSCLTLSHTRTKVPKRAMWNETPIRSVQFIDERSFDIRGWQVKLLPEGITRRRQWSKKYPICLIKCDDCGNLNHDDFSINEDEINIGKSEKEFPQTLSTVCLTTAKYAKRSSSNDSLELVIENPKVDKKVSKVDNYEDTEKTPSDRSKQKLDSADRDVSDVEEDSFCVITSDIVSQNIIYLFARADREKEEWYRRFAVSVRENEIHSLPVTPLFGITSLSSEQLPLTPEKALATMGEYLHYMQHFHLEHKMYPPRPKHQSLVKDEKKSKDKEKDKERDKEKDKDKDPDKDHIDSMIEAAEEKAVMIGLPLSWLNAITGRICFDLLRSSFWQGKILQRLQKKLSTLKLPYFMEALTITELDLGNTLPVFHRASQPSIDVRGLWIELDMTYQGNFRMTIESKVNLLKLKRSTPDDIPLTSVPLPIPSALDISTSRSPVFDSDLDDSAESSSDDDTSSINTEDGSNRQSVSSSSKNTGKKLLRMVDKIAASKYFQQATEMKYIKKAMEGVSNTRIMLSVELKGLVGTLAVNIPPPPSDRLWYGFHGNPKLWLSAHPTLGERQVNFYHISNWIEQKLCQEFQKILVLPNMDDIVIPVMSPHLPV